MGLTWDGLPSLAPTFALPEFNSVLIFLSCYCIGTALFMAFVTSFVSHATLLLGDMIGNSLPLSLSLIASIISIISGAFWLLYAGVVAFVGDDESLSSVRLYFSYFVIISSAVSSLLVITSLTVQKSALSTSILSPLVDYWTLVTRTQRSSQMSHEKLGVHTV